jgi:tetratricopeptide (TPR) repeat protein
VKRHKPSRPLKASRGTPGQRANGVRLRLLLALLVLAGGAWGWQRHQLTAAAEGALAEGLDALSRRDTETAARAFRRALQIDPQLPGAHTQLGRLAVQQSNYEAAILHFSAAVLQQPGNAEAITDLGIARLESGNWAEAVDTFQQATRIAPHSAAALRGLGEAYRRAQRWDEAVAALERARQLQPDDSRTLYLLALALAQRGRAPDDPRRALDLLADARRRGIPDPPVHYATGLACLAQGHLPEAIAALEAAAREEPGDDQALYHLGEAYRQAGRLDAAQKTLAAYDTRSKRRQRLRSLRERVMLQPDNLVTRRRLAEACLEAQEYREAIRHLMLLANAGASDAPLYDLFVHAWEGLGLKVPADQARAMAAKIRGEGSPRTPRGAG